MSIEPIASPDLAALAREVLGRGAVFRFRVRGCSMRPTIRDGDVVAVQPLDGAAVRKGRVVLTCDDTGRLLVHRIVKTEDRGRGSVVTRGDALSHCDAMVRPDAVLGEVVAVERRGWRHRPLHYGLVRWLRWCRAGLVVIRGLWLRSVRYIARH